MLGAQAVEGPLILTPGGQRGIRIPVVFQDETLRDLVARLADGFAVPLLLGTVRARVAAAPSGD
jgi:hypothetical protein